MLRFVSYILIFAAGSLLGSILPSYGMQYVVSVESKLEQVNVDLAAFQVIADRYHQGSLTNLIDHHLASDDPTFHAEGQAIRTMLQAREGLESARAALSGSVLEQFRFFIREFDLEAARSTWRAYEPGILLNRDALVFSVSIGLLCCVLSLLSLRILRICLSRGVKVVRDS